MMTFFLYLLRIGQWLVRVGRAMEAWADNESRTGG
jgi:hypothetical protein